MFNSIVSSVLLTIYWMILYKKKYLSVYVEHYKDVMREK